MVLLSMQADYRKPFSIWMLLAGLYVTQSLGMSFFVIALVAILREQGATLERISLIYMLGMLSACKFLWAPLIDCFRLTRRCGHYKGWLLLTQTGLAAGLVTIGMLDVAASFPAVYVLCLFVTFCCATQDIAVDGLACRLLTPAERGIGNGLQTAGGLLSYLIGGGLVLILYPHIGWRSCLWLLAAGTALSLVQLIFFAEPTWRATSQQTGHRMLRFVTFWRHERAGSWLVILLCYSISIAMAWGILMPVLIDAGWTVGRIGLVVNVPGTLVGFIAAISTGWLIRHVSRRRAILLAALSQVVAVTALAFPVLGYTSETPVIVAVCIYFFFYNPAMAVIGTLIMDHASAQTPATDYTLQFGLYQLSAMTMSSLGVWLAGQIGYPTVYGTALLAALLAVLFSMRYTLRQAMQHEPI